MSYGITGYTDVRYKLNTVYKAVANTNRSLYRIYFLFSPKFEKCVSIGEGIHVGPEWSTYRIANVTEIRHVRPEGTWILKLYPEKSPTWMFVQDDGYKYNPTISLASDKDPAVREYDWARISCDTIIYDDIVDAATYAWKATTKDDVKKATEWYKGMKEKEVKKKMYLQAIDVIFFDRKSKKVVYREIVVANDTEGAYMLAAQSFGKYDPKVHVKYAHCMFGFNEQNPEEDEEESSYKLKT